MHLPRELESRIGLLLLASCLRTVASDGAPGNTLPMRNLIVVLGDQLDSKSSAFDRFDKRQDAVWMAELADEASYVWSHKARIATFLSAMRHFRDDLRRRGITVYYRQLADRGNRGTFSSELAAAARKYRPQRLILVEPGEWRVKTLFENTATQLGIDLELRLDRHFFASHDPQPFSTTRDGFPGDGFTTVRCQTYFIRHIDDPSSVLQIDLKLPENHLKHRHICLQTPGNGHAHCFEPFFDRRSKKIVKVMRSVHHTVVICVEPGKMIPVPETGESCSRFPG